MFVICFLLMFASVCFKSISCVAHEMRVESGWRRERHTERHEGQPGRHVPAPAALVHKPGALPCSLYRHHPDTSAPD
jgi:hypothetical protein